MNCHLNILAHRIFYNSRGIKVGITVQALLFGLMHGLPFGLVTGNALVVILLTLLPGVMGWIEGWLNGKCASGSIVPSWIMIFLHEYIIRAECSFLNRISMFKVMRFERIIKIKYKA